VKQWISFYNAEKSANQRKSLSGVCLVTKVSRQVGILDNIGIYHSQTPSAADTRPRGFFSEGPISVSALLRGLWRWYAPMRLAFQLGELPSPA
jgi:hypothetical protein